jgi:hypothetical protein
MTELDLTPVEALERHFWLVVSGALPHDSPLTEIEPRQVPDADAVCWDRRTNQEHYVEGLETFIARHRRGFKVSIPKGRQHSWWLTRR